MSTTDAGTSGAAGKDAPKPAAKAETAPAAASVAKPKEAEKRGKRGKAWAMGGVVLLVVAAGLWWIVRSWGIVSTDDAYVDGHVTFVAPRVTGQVKRVLVDDNNRVKKGDVLVALDKEPFEVQVGIAQAGVAAAESDLTLAQAEARSQEGLTRSLRFKLQHAIEDVDNQVALLRSKVAVLQSARASLEEAQADYDRALPLLSRGALTHQEMDQRSEALLVAKAKVEEALQGIYQVRVSLGLQAVPEKQGDAALAEVPADLDQTFSSVLEAQASLIQAAALLGIMDSVRKSPQQMIADFYKRDPEGNIDRIYAQLLKNAPGVKQAEAKVEEAQRNLDQANLNLKYCDVVAEIDGVVTRRAVNPGDNVVAGQALMAVRSLREIWVTANFKETQLGKLRIGQAVDLDVDMYGGRERFKGRISGFTMGTGSTLALLPPENATGNFVKVVQRLPVRIELVDYDPTKAPLFIGLSVTPRVHVDEAPTGPNAGDVLQPYEMRSPARGPAGSLPAAGTETRP